MRSDYIETLHDNLGRITRCPNYEYEYAEYLIKQNGSFTIPIKYELFAMDLLENGEIRLFQNAYGIIYQPFGDFVITGFFRKLEEKK